MNRYLAVLFTVAVSAVASTSASAAPSACVVYADGSTSPVEVQYSCDGSDLTKLFDASGISAGISKAIPCFMAKGY